MDVHVFGASVQIDPAYVAEPEPLIRDQLNEYLDGERQEFDLTIAFPDDFTGRVMRAMNRVPYGQTTTYGAIATELDTAPIAVGQACGRNPVPIIVPCHRVLAADGLGGYSSGGDRNLDVKQGFLDLEAKHATTPPTA